jgi:O-methyltransferase
MSSRDQLRRGLRFILHAVECNLIYPWAAWRGWRPSSLRSVRPEDLAWEWGYEHEASIKEAIAIVAPYTVLSLDRLASLWWQIEYLDRQQIRGALVECGVRQGGASAMMALAHMASSDRPMRDLHLFDSFSQMPAPSQKDGATAPILMTEWQQKMECSPDVSRELLVSKVGYPRSLIHYHVGLFRDTVATAAQAIGPISLLRLDGDWYESTKQCLDGLYENVSYGGLVVIDDYGHFEGCRAAVDEFRRELSVRSLLHRIDCTGRYWVKTTPVERSVMPAPISNCL